MEWNIESFVIVLFLVDKNWYPKHINNITLNVTSDALERDDYEVLNEIQILIIRDIFCQF